MEVVFTIDHPPKCIDTGRCRVWVIPKQLGLGKLGIHGVGIKSVGKVAQ